MSQNTALVKQNDDAGAIMERVLIVGDLQQLTPDERCRYYNRVCESLGLNPLTRPFDYLKLNGKLQLYAKKDATEQLRKINRISIYKIEKEQEGDLYTVTAYGRTADGREDVDMGATTTKGLSGDNLVNARLKAVTKAKRRLTLSMSGLGFLDETEIETIPQAQRIPVTVEGEIVTHAPAKVLPMLPPPNRSKLKPQHLQKRKPFTTISNCSFSSLRLSGIQLLLPGQTVRRASSIIFRRSPKITIGNANRWQYVPQTN